MVKPIVKVNRMFPVSGDKATKAFCDITLYDAFVVTGLKIVEGQNGLFVSMPRQKGRDGKWYDSCFPVSKEVRDEMEKFILEQYASNKVTGKAD
ncbi:MAG TPA: SpoVG family protein [Candidatus Omnitrophota bacterium]|nr:SpoVG family protein [Candidatus Omnitrophota bacterium]HPS21013.1 SpoVG family protein [Candidatus Omnitrophota bacterium]